LEVAERQGDGNHQSIAELRDRLFRNATTVRLAARYLTEEAELSDDDSMIAVVIAEAADEPAELHGDLDAWDASGPEAGGRGCGGSVSLSANCGHP
jgi:hypothetical protein